MVLIRHTCFILRHHSFSVLCLIVRYKMDDISRKSRKWYVKCITLFRWRERYFSGISPEMWILNTHQRKKRKIFFPTTKKYIMKRNICCRNTREYLKIDARQSWGACLRLFFWCQKLQLVIFVKWAWKKVVSTCMHRYRTLGEYLLAHSIPWVYDASNSISTYSF